MKKLISNYTWGLLTATIILHSGCSVKEETPAVSEEIKVPENVILMIGDGMGMGQITTSFYFNDAVSNFESFKDIGFIKTSSTSHKVTDSAAGATAFATGQKTYKRAIGVSTDSVALPNLVEILEERGFKTGLVSLSSITHATPAGFYAHVKDRDSQDEIAEQLVTSGVDFFAAGGIRYFAHRTDGQDLYKQMEAEHNYILDSVSLAKVTDPVKKYGFLLAREGLPSKIEGRGDFLPEASELALSHLSKSSDGFFLMIEGSYIDWAGHARDSEMLVEEMLDFEKTMGKVLDFVTRNDNTLLIVTADHETGGVSVGKSGRPDSVAITFTTDQHTSDLVPVFAKGPGSENFRGIYENNEIFGKIQGLLEAVE